MKQLHHFLAGLLICGLALIAVPATAQEGVPDTLLSPVGWIEFSDNLVEAITSENEGAKEGALTQIIRYGDYLEFDRRTSFDVMRLYRDHEDDNMRQLAVVALGKMNDRWAIEFMDMLSRFEGNEQIKSTMEHTVQEYWERHPDYRP